jgi:hypothetical protein
MLTPTLPSRFWAFAGINSLLFHFEIRFWTMGLFVTQKNALCSGVRLCVFAHLAKMAEFPSLTMTLAMFELFCARGKRRDSVSIVPSAFRGT